MKPIQVDGVELEEAVDGIVAYRLEKGSVTYLNATAALVMSLCRGRLEIDEIAVWVGKAFGLGETPRADVEQSLSELQQAGLIRWE